MHGYCTPKLGNIIGLILKCLDTVYILLQNYTAVRINPFSLFADDILLLFGFWAVNGYVTWAEGGGGNSQLNSTHSAKAKNAHATFFHHENQESSFSVMLLTDTHMTSWAEATIEIENKTDKNGWRKNSIL